MDPQSVAQHAVDTYGALPVLFTSLMLFIGVFGMPILFVLTVRFLWTRTVYIRPSREMWAMMREFQRAMPHAEHGQHAGPHGDLPTSEMPGHDVHLSMFGR